MIGTQLASAYDTFSAAIAAASPKSKGVATTMTPSFWAQHESCPTAETLSCDINEFC
jgi:hypothetical protein